MRRLIASVLILLLAAAAWAQPIDAPHNERGFSANKVFEVGGVDHISPFDGNLLLTIPIGGDYPLRPGFTYGLMLFYNGKVWDVDYQPNPPFDYYRSYEPHKGFNAGVGWTLSLGQLLEPQALINQGNSLWAYVSPDGSKHDFYTELHPGESQTGSTFTRDSSYLRMRVSGSQRRIDMPDGSRHFFENASDGTGIWRLVRLEDAFGNWMQVAYTTATWTISDMHGRSHVVTFTAAPDPLDRVVDKVEVEQFGSAGLAVWDFIYNDVSLDPGECGLTTDPLGSPRFDMKFLSRLERPDGSAFEMPDYAISTDQTSCGPTTGRIRSMTLPTQGEIEWDYGAYVMPRESCQSCAGNFTPNESVTGVVERRHRSASGSLLGTWDYSPIIDNPIEGSERQTTVTKPAPLGHKTTYYFSVHRHEFGAFNDAWTRYEYGLPFTRNRRLADDFPGLLDGSPARPDLFLSRQIFEAGSSEPLRSVYVRYERETPLSTELSDVSNADRRLQHELTIYHDYFSGTGDIGFTETIWSDFDGLGHYRTQTRHGNLTSLTTLESRETHSEWNSGRGELITDSSSGQQTGASSFTLPPAGGPWILGTAAYTEYRQGGVTRRVERTYRNGDGFLECQRTLKNGTNRGPNDVLQVFADGDQDGSPNNQSSFGGDYQTISAAAGCSVPSQAEFKTRHTYVGGALEKSIAVKTCSSGQTEEDFLAVTDLDIDADTGLAKTSRDAAGTPTDFAYDALSRLSAVTPRANPADLSQDVDAATFYTYTNASGSTNAARVDIRLGSISVPLTHQRLLFDGFGRLCREQTKMPAGWSDRKTSYLVTGLTSQVTERVGASLATSCGALGSTPRTTFDEYDPFGRADTITPSDGASHIVNFIRTGDWREIRTVKTAINENGTESSVNRTSFFDSFGRLAILREASDDIGPGAEGNIDTEYFYDPQDRLTRVKTLSPTSSENQNRYFTYDGRGFLTKEEHPELGGDQVLVGAISFTYDSRGNAVTRVDDRATLRTVYDAAGRPTQVWENLGTGDRLLKEFFYGTANQSNNWSLGQLVETRRHNYIDLADPANRSTSFSLTTSQRLTYAGRSGRLSSVLTSAETTLGAVYAFRTGFIYDSLGNVTSIDYPECLHEGCATVPTEVETLTMDYWQGLLTGIPGYVNSLTYHQNGLIHQVTHANSRVDTTTLASNQMARPASMSTSGSPTWSSGTFGYDGAGNIKSLSGSSAADQFIYDRVDRLIKTKLDQSIAPGHFRSYEYDIHGNRIQIDRNGTVENVAVTSSRNRLDLGAYDAAGNLMTYAGTFTFTWDGNNTMMSSSGPDFDNVYLYTADDERLATIDLTELAEGTVRETWTLRGLGNEVLRIYKTENSSWRWQQDHIYRGKQLAASETAEDDGPLHYHLDHLGSPRLITTTGGAQQSQHAYFPFGPEWTPPGEEKLKFTGHERDQNGTLVGGADDFDYMHARYCLPDFGRFLSLDPVQSAKLRSPQTWNKYQYARNNPLGRIDPDGREDQEPEMVRLPEGQFAIRIDNRQPESGSPDLRAAAEILAHASLAAVPPGAQSLAGFRAASALNAQGSFKVVSSINRNHTLVRAARGLSGNQQRAIDTITARLRNGVFEGGRGTRPLPGIGAGIFEARHNNGARVIFRVDGETVEILAKFNKSKQEEVFKVLRKILSSE